jgi:hypothetical protein
VVYCCKVDHGSQEGCSDEIFGDPSWWGPEMIFCKMADQGNQPTNKINEKESPKGLPRPCKNNIWNKTGTRCCQYIDEVLAMLLQSTS